MTRELSDFDFSYDAASVAQQPLADRDASRMMVLRPGAGTRSHRAFADLPDFLQPGDLVVVNDTAVTSCRIFSRKATGGRVEIFLLSKVNAGGASPWEWRCWLSPARGLSEGQILKVASRDDESAEGPAVTVVSLLPDDVRVRFASAAEEATALTAFSEMPLPPYIERARPRAEDRDRYQTIFAAKPGAVAAPTAGLHFTPRVKQSLAERGVAWTTVTLHVGPGTFLPVKTASIDEHVMHRESYEIPEATQTALHATRERGGKILAVGTTALRALETWAWDGEGRGETGIYIRPGHEFRVVDHLLTNFHQPKSTLLILVSALAGREFILSSYQEAIRENYRLFSYGDCMLILRP